MTFKADNATDVDGDPISYTWKNNATGAVMGTGKVLELKNLKKGHYTVTLEVIDGSHTVTKNVSFTIKAKKTNGGVIPGFEVAFLLMALAVALAFVARRRR